MSTFAQRKAQTLKRQGKTTQLESMNKSRASSGLTPLTGSEATSESTYIDKSTNSIVGRTSGKVLAVGTSLADALAKQNQVSGGSTPGVSGRPDLYGTTPLATEGQSYFDESTQTTVTPKTATADQLKQVETGTLESFNKAQGLTYLDMPTFKKLQPLLNKSDLIRGPNGQISLKQGLSPDQVLARATTGVTGTATGVSGVTGTGDFNVEVPDAFTTDSVSEFLDVPVTDTDFNTMMAEIKAQQDELLGLMVPGADEQAIKAQIVDIKDQVEKSLVELSMGLNNVEDQPIAMQFITGQQASIQRSAEAKLQNLARIETNLLNELGLEQEARQVEASVAQTKLGYLQTNLDTAFKVKEMIAQEEDRIFNRAQALKSSAQSALSTILETMQGVRESDMSADQQKQLQDMAISAGIPYSLLTKGMDNVASQVEYERVLAGVKTGVSDGDILSSAQKLLDGGYASSLDEAIRIVKSSLSGESTLTSGTSFVTDTGIFDVNSYSDMIGNGTIVEGSTFHHEADDGGTYEVDIDGKIGDAIIAPVSGTVISAGNAGGYGNSVVIQDSSGNQWRLAHFDSLSVEPGQQISSGAVVGLMGNTGNVIKGEGGDGSHLHMEIKDSSGNYINPRTLTVENQINDKQTSAVEQAANNLAVSLTSDKSKALRQSIRQSISSGDLQGAVETIQSASISAIPTEQQNKAYGRLQSLRALDSIEESLAAYEEAGGDTNLISGKAEDLSNKVLGSTNDPALAKIANDITLAIIAYRASVSGAAFTESEAKTYNEIFPNTANTSTLNATKIASLRQAFDLNQRVIMESVIGKSNYDDLFSDLLVPKADISSLNIPSSDESGLISNDGMLNNVIDFIFNM